MRYVAMLVLLAFLVVPLAGCKKEETVPSKPPTTEPAEPAAPTEPAAPAAPAAPAEPATK